MRGDRINSPRGSYTSRQRLIGGRLLQRAVDDAMRTAISLSRRHIGATRRAGTFVDNSHIFVSSGIPEHVPREGGGVTWARRIDESPIQTKTRI
jgi:hypothetical protein